MEFGLALVCLSYGVSMELSLELVWSSYGFSMELVWLYWVVRKMIQK